MMLPNCPDFVHLWFGLAKLGAVEVPINTSYKGEFLRHIVDQSDSKVLVVEGEWLPRVLFILDQLPKLPAIVVRGEVPAEGEGRRGGGRGRSRHRLARSPRMVRSPSSPGTSSSTPPRTRSTPTSSPRTRLSIIYTSGTTGLSKGALGSHKFWVVCRREDARLPRRRQGRRLLHLPAAVPLQRPGADGADAPWWPRRPWCSRTSSAPRASGTTSASTARPSSTTWARSSPSWRSSPRGPTTRTTRPRIALGAGCPADVMREVEERFGIICLEGFGMSEIGIPIHVRVHDRRRGIVRQTDGHLRHPPGRRPRRAGAGGRAGRDRLPPPRAVHHDDRLLQHAREDPRGVPQPVVPLGRPGPAGRGRLLLLRRPQEGRAAAAGREHLVVRGRARHQHPPGGAGIGGGGGQVRAGRGRGQDLRRPAARRHPRPRRN